MGTLASALRTALTFGPATRTLPDNIERAFAARCAKQFDAHARLVATLAFACNLLWWPTDWLVFHAVPNAIPIAIKCRITVAASCMVYLGLPRIPLLERHIIALFGLTSGLVCFAAGWAAGMVGSPDTPYFHALYVAVFGTVPLPLPLGRRIGLTGVLALATAAGLFLPHPEYIHSAHVGLCISFLVFGILLSTWFGHTPFRLSRENFAQSHALSENAALLERRVAERTDELRRLLDHVETAREVERARIARELHDELGQELSALRYSLGYTITRYRKAPMAITANLEDLEGLLRRTAQTTRNLVTDLRPRVLDDLGLDAALAWLVQRTDQRSGLACTLDVRGDLAGLPDRVAITAFRVAQEALTNVVRHAEASRAIVTVVAEPGSLSLCVEDDGIGLGASRRRGGEETSGVGLLGMHERVQSLDGSLSIHDHAPLRGTEVRCRLPIGPVSRRSRISVAA